jgi:hypothetical protein
MIKNDLNINPKYIVEKLGILTTPGLWSKNYSLYGIKPSIWWKVKEQIRLWLLSSGFMAYKNDET